MSIWTGCMLDGAELNAAVARLLGETVVIRGDQAVHPEDLWPYVYDYTNGKELVSLITEQQVFLSPPHSLPSSHNEASLVGSMWTATVSAAVRTKPNPRGSSLPSIVGRGCGQTPGVAVCRAFVDSFPKEQWA